jgi:hypothetical protein
MKDITATDPVSSEPKLSDFKQDTRNANKGNDRGNAMIQQSIKRLGTGRSIVVDKDGTIIAGNKTAENALAVGMEDVIVVESDGTKLIVVRRTDLDLETDPAARELAIADNRTSEVSMTWDVEQLESLAVDTEVPIGISNFFTGDEFASLTVPDVKLPEKEITLTPQKFVRALISVPVESALQARALLDSLGKIEGVEVDYGAN